MKEYITLGDVDRSCGVDEPGSLFNNKIIACPSRENADCFIRWVPANAPQEKYWRLLLEWYVMLNLGPDLCPPVVRLAQNAEGATLVLAWPDGFDHAISETRGTLSALDGLTAAMTLVDQLLILQREGLLHGRLIPENILLSSDFKQLRLLDWRALHLCGLPLDGGPPNAVAAVACRVCHGRGVARCRQALGENDRQTLSILKILLAPLRQEFCFKSEQGDLVEHGMRHEFSDVSFLYELIVKPNQTEDNLPRKMSISDLRRQLEVFLCHWRRGTSLTSCVISPEPAPRRVTNATPLARHERILSLLHLLQPSKSYSELAAREVAACSTAAMIHEVRNPNTLVRGALFHLERWGQVFERLLSALVEEDQTALKQVFREQFQVFREQLKALDGGTLQIEAVLQGWPSLRKPSQARWLSRSLNNMLDGLLSLFRVRFGDSVVFNAEWSFHASVRCLHGYLEQVFINLLLNACQAVQRRDGDALAPGQVTLSIGERGGMWLVGIHDNGVGFDSAALQPSVIAEETGMTPAGRGFGLAICRHLLKHHGGSLDLSGQPGRGALVRVILPKLTAEPQAAEVRDSVASPAYCPP